MQNPVVKILMSHRNVISGISALVKFRETRSRRNCAVVGKIIVHRGKGSSKAKNMGRTMGVNMAAAPIR